MVEAHGANGAQHFGRDTTPFFHKPETHALISRLANLDSLVIWVGSGATIDRTGYQWKELVDKLLADTYSESARQFAARWLSEAAGGSAVEEAYGQLHPNDGAIAGAIRAKLSNLLYSSGGYFGGALVRAIGELAIAFKETGRRVVVVTPNYDTYLRSEIEKLVARRGLPLTVEEVDWTDPGNKLAAGNRVPTTISRNLDQRSGLAIVHLHGVAPGPTDQVRNGARVVLSEAAYENSASRSDGLLVPLLRSSHLLIVGAGMTDPPLLRSLLKTKAYRREKKLTTTTIFSHQSIIGDTVMAEADVREVESIIGKRLNHLGVEDGGQVFTDFYYQNAQLLVETAMATRMACNYASSNDRYGLRLQGWWGSWERRNTTTSRNQDLQTGKATLPAIASALGRPGATDLNMELWLRWEPNGSERTLRRWISTEVQTYTTAGVTPGEEVRIAVQRGADSSSRVAQVFCQGRQLTVGDVEGDAWVGAVLTHELHTYKEMPFPVGVVVIRGPKDNWAIRLSEAAGARSISTALTLAIEAIASDVFVPYST